MANLNEIKARIASINSTKKITRAMYLIAASKSQKAKTMLANSFPFFQKITRSMAEIMASTDGMDSPYLKVPQPDDARPRLFIVLGSDKGMAGGYNHSIMDLVASSADKQRDELWVAGHLSRRQLLHLGYTVDEGFFYPVMDPSLFRARDISDLIVEAFDSGKYRSIHALYMEMVTSLKQVPTLMQLLPLSDEALRQYTPEDIVREEFEYLPGPREVFDHLVPHYMKGIVYSTLVEAFASEQSARMYAMDGATKSANESIDRLSIEYNRVRQAKITQELTEIVAGIPQG